MAKYCLACGHSSKDVIGGLCPQCREDELIRKPKSKKRGSDTKRGGQHER